MNLQYILLVFSLFLSFTVTAQLTLTTPVSDEPLRLRIGDKLEVETNGWYIQEDRMDFYQELHRFFLDSMPNLLEFKAAYELMNAQQTADYLQLRDALQISQIQTKKTLRQAESIMQAANGQLTVVTQQSETLASINKQIEKAFKKQHGKGFWKILGDSLLVGVGVGIGYLAFK